MKDYNKIKTDMLGEDFQKCQARLKKMLLFDLARSLGRDVCLRCGHQIQTPQEFSIDHVQSWMHKPNARDLFFDLDNIAFSHLSCNSGARTQNVTRIGELGLKGVRRVKRALKADVYHATIAHNKKMNYLGTFATAEDAARCYDQKAKELYGDRAVTNESLGLLI